MTTTDLNNQTFATPISMNAALLPDLFQNQLRNLFRAQKDLKLNLERSRTLANRISLVVEQATPLLHAPITDLRTKPNLVLLVVLIEEVYEYVTIFSSHSRSTIDHLVPDEELYCKWNERLQFIILSLNLNLDINVVFNKKEDQMDLRADIVSPR
jgi:hypothetical protein